MLDPYNAGCTPLVAACFPLDPVAQGPHHSALASAATRETELIVFTGSRGADARIARIHSHMQGCLSCGATARLMASGDLRRIQGLSLRTFPGHRNRSVFISSRVTSTDERAELSTDSFESHCKPPCGSLSNQGDYCLCGHVHLLSLVINPKPSRQTRGPERVICQVRVVFINVQSGGVPSSAAKQGQSMLAAGNAPDDSGLCSR